MGDMTDKPLSTVLHLGTAITSLDHETLIALVIDSTDCSRDQAMEALNFNNNDIVTSIMV